MALQVRQVISILLAALLSMVPVLLISYGDRPAVFYATLGGLGSFVVASLPGDWRQLRDRWARFHMARTFASVAGLALMVAGAVFG